MGVAFSLILAVIVVSLAAVLGVSILYRMMINFQPGRNKIQKDVEELKADLAPLITDLVPWDQDEMELLSLNTASKSKNHRITKTIKGVFTSIYHEPMIAWSYRKYLSQGENAILYARSAKHEWVFRILPKGTEVYIDGQAAGKINSQGMMYDVSGKNLIGKLQSADPKFLSVVVENRELASLSTQGSSAKVNERAFPILQTMDDRQEQIVLSLSLLEMVRREI